MSENTNSTPQRDEIDLGQLFKMIGNAFQKIFDFIASIFKVVYKTLILLLIHFFKNAKWYALATAMGLITGYFLEKSTKKDYYANMFIETKFNSSRKVYEVIKEFNQLAAVDRDSIEIARRLGISPNEALSIKGFYIEADRDETELFKDFLTYKSGLDSLSQLEVTFDDYKKQQSDYHFKDHKIGVIARNKYVFKKINDGIVSEFLDNEYITKIRETTLKNLDRQEASIDSRLESLDSLLITYLDIRKKESEKEFTASQGTNFYMSSTQKSELLVDESSILNQKAELLKEKQKIALNRVTNEKQVNIISDFPPTGYQLFEWYNNKMIILPIISVLLLLLFFGIKRFGKFVQDNALQ